MRERERGGGQNVDGSKRRRNWGDALDGWADASSNVLPVIERRLKVDDGNFGAMQTPRLAGTWTSPHDVSWTRSWLNRAAKGNICRRNVCLYDFSNRLHIRTNGRRISNFRRRFKMYNLSLWMVRWEGWISFIHTCENFRAKFWLEGREDFVRIAAGWSPVEFYHVAASLCTRLARENCLRKKKIKNRKNKIRDEWNFHDSLKRFSLFYYEKKMVAITLRLSWLENRE